MTSELYVAKAQAYQAQLDAYEEALEYFRDKRDLVLQEWEAAAKMHQEANNG